ncbi:MAG: hypothetical protein N2111_03930 [Candidatus Sumerlaeaceae bacterium]|nr:hypothetical protein [Candidatus Sumerlaeaceae bacterium]
MKIRLGGLAASLYGRLFALMVAAMAAGCATAGGRRPAPDCVTVTAVGYYKPVAMPGTQRRVAQNEAEAAGRRQLLEIVGAMPLAGGGTVRDAMARNSVMRADILNIVRTAEVADWQVDPACGRVTVWMRLDLNRVRETLAAYGY